MLVQCLQRYNIALTLDEHDIRVASVIVMTSVTRAHIQHQQLNNVSPMLAQPFSPLALTPSNAELICKKKHRNQRFFFN